MSRKAPQNLISENLRMFMLTCTERMGQSLFQLIQFGILHVKFSKCWGAIVVLGLTISQRGLLFQC